MLYGFTFKYTLKAFFIRKISYKCEKCAFSEKIIKL